MNPNQSQVIQQPNSTIPQTQTANPTYIYQQPKNNSKTVIIVVLVIVAIICICCLVASAAGGIFTKGFSEAFNSALSQYSNMSLSKNSASVADQLSANVVELNKLVPRMIDSETRLDNAVSYGSTLQYNYTMVNYNVADLDVAKFSSLIKAQILNNLKISTDLTALKNLNVNFTFNYKDKNGEIITTVDIFPSDYK